MSTAIRIHSENPKIFEFRGRPLVLVAATEHYGAVMNRPFDYGRYLADAAAKKMTLTRLFLLFRELQTSINPHSTCKPESTDYVTPFQRTGTEKSKHDRLPMYDLDKWNPEFFERLHGFLSLASDYGIIVEVTLFSNTYTTDVWQLNPLHAENNINGLEDIEWPNYLSKSQPKRFERQLAYTRKIVSELNKYDNFFFEICNEPGGKAGNPGNPGNPDTDEVDEWQKAIAAAIRETEVVLPNEHLVVGQEAFTYSPWEQSSTKSFDDMPIDVVNIHPLPNTTYRGKSYDMGNFMSKELKLRAFTSS